MKTTSIFNQVKVRKPEPTKIPEVYHLKQADHDSFRWTGSNRKEENITEIDYDHLKHMFHFLENMAREGRKLTGHPMLEKQGNDLLMRAHSLLRYVGAELYHREKEMMENKEVKL